MKRLVGRKNVVGAGLVGASLLAGCASSTAARDGRPASSRTFYNCNTNAFPHDDRCVVSGGPRPETIQFPGD